MSEYPGNVKKHGLPFENPHFPAYLRLFKWRILDICIEKTTDSAFYMFEPIFGREELLHLITFIRYTEDCIDKEKKDMNIPEIEKEPLMCEEKRQIYNEKVLKRKRYIAKIREREIQIVRRGYIEYFFQKVLFCKQGVRIIDRLLFSEKKHLYDQVHWDNCPEDWLPRETFFKKFYKLEEEQIDGDQTEEDVVKIKNPYEHQLLDSVAGAARGNLIYSFFTKEGPYTKEQEAAEFFLNDRGLDIRTELVKNVIYEGAANIIEINGDGEEVRRPNKLIWSVHKTNLLFAALPLIPVQTLPVPEREDWYFNLLKAMKGDPHNRAALWFLQKDYKDILKERDDARQRERILMFSDVRENEREKMVNDKEKVDTLRPQPVDSFKTTEEENNIELKLREYQEELVLPVLRGKNTVIVAPTGSGKTEVAISAALQHIQERELKKKASRVVMLVPKIPLVSQQADRFLKYCRGKYRVEQCYGSEHTDGKGRKDNILRAHIVVMTPQILLNMWQSVRENERLYVCDFSMVVFDEVHKTTGNHPYGEIARMIEMYNGNEKPQVIGLTASLNVKATASNDMTRMLGEIYKLLAMLNATVLSTIKKPESIAELNKHVSKPDDSVIPCQPPLSDRSRMRGFLIRFLKSLHTKLIEDIERMMKIRAASVFNTKFLKFAKLINLDDVAYYESWLQQVASNLDKINTNEKRLAQINVEYLKCVVEARGIVELMPAYVAFDYLANRFDELRKNYDFPQFTSQFDTHRESLNNQKRNPEDNVDPEIVAQLKNTLKHQFTEEPNSRAIIFVVQRSTAERVAHFLNESRILGGDHDFDYVLGTNNQGAVKQSQTTQKSVINRFNDGKLKVMVATSVVEEGLDVATCNLIIKYNCSSGSAIQLTQQRGRARAKNSRSVLLVVTGSVNENENNALIAEKYMRQCVATIQKNGQKDLEKKVGEEKAKLRRQREQDLKEKQYRERSLQSKVYKVQCTKCSNVQFCTSDKIKKKYSNYMIMDPEVWDKLELEVRKKSKFIDENTQPLCHLKCTYCRSDMGKAYKQNGVYVPQIDVKNLAFIENSSNVTAHRQRWTMVEQDLFFIAEANESNYKEMLNALNNNEKNHAKKRILDGEAQQFLKDLEEREQRETRRRQAEERKKKEQQQPKVSWNSEDENEEEKEEYENIYDEY